MFVPRKLDREKPIWQTCEGRKLPRSLVTHQHWSNIYWYNKIFSTDPQNPHKFRMRSCISFAESNLQTLYSGKILEYKPVYSFEVEWLKKISNVTIKEKVIYFEGKRIGTIPNEVKQLW